MTKKTDDGSIVLTAVDSDGNEREIILRADDDGNIEIEGRGPNGNRKGKMDPTGNGSNPLGK